MTTDYQQRRNRRKNSVNRERRSQLLSYISQLTGYWGTYNRYLADGGPDFLLTVQALERALSFESLVKDRVAETKFHDKAQWFERIEKAKLGPPKKKFAVRRTRTYQAGIENRMLLWTDDEGNTKTVVNVRWNLSVGCWAIRIQTSRGDYENTHLGPMSADMAYHIAQQVDLMKAFLVHNRWLTLHRWRADQWNDVVMAKAYPPDITLDLDNPLHAHLAEWMRRVERKLFLHDTGSPWVTLREIPLESEIQRAADSKTAHK